MKVIVVCGPTAVGKSDLAITLAEKFNGEIINADSMQVYQEMNIGTAKITDDKGIKHHLLDIRKPYESYSVYEYQRDARAKINEIIKKGKTPIMVGGTGLYIRAALYDYQFEGSTRNDDKVIHGQPELLYSAIFIGLTTNRETLYEQINKRVDIMIEQGLETEVKRLYEKYPQSRALQTAIGYKELINNEDINKLKQNSRHYAKRQYTWFNNQLPVAWFDINKDNYLNEIIKVIKSSK